MSNPIQTVVDRVAGVAAKVAASSSLIVEGTVISRNPDGSLNVDDGTGGCVRQAPKQSAHIGDRIRIGTQPALGTVTNLPQINRETRPSVRSCPDDPRLDGPHVVSPIVINGTTYKTANLMLNWGERDSDHGTGVPNTPANHYGKISSAVSAPSTSGLLRTIIVGDSYDFDVIGVSPSENVYESQRAYVKFDFAANGVSPSGVIVATLKLSINTSPSAVSVDNIKIAIVPASVVFPMTIAQLPLIDRTKVLGRFLILGGWTTGDSSFGISVVLDLSSMPQPLPDPLVLCLLSDYDVSGITPPTVGAVPNLLYQNIVNLIVGLPGHGEPTLQVEHEVPPPL